MRQSLEQKRAGRAFQSGENKSKDFFRLAKRLPAMLQMNGLLATWAYLQKNSKETNEFKAILDVIIEHFKDDSFQLSKFVSDNRAKETFQNWVKNDGTGLTGHQLRLLTDEAIAFSAWLKRAAETYGE